MVINLLGPQVVIHPLVDQDFLNVLTYDTRDFPPIKVYDWLVYQDTEHGFRSSPSDAYFSFNGGIQTTIFLEGPSRIFRCRHEWKHEDEKARGFRCVTFKLENKMLLFAEDDKIVGVENNKVVAIDLTYKLELDKPQNLWDIVCRDNL
jgi:hypothetical protein